MSARRDEPRLVLPQVELKKVAAANLKLVDIAKGLNNLAGQLDQQTAAALRLRISELLESSETISDAVQKSRGQP